MVDIKKTLIIIVSSSSLACPPFGVGASSFQSPRCQVLRFYLYLFLLHVFSYITSLHLITMSSSIFLIISLTPQWKLDIRHDMLSTNTLVWCRWCSTVSLHLPRHQCPFCGSVKHSSRRTLNNIIENSFKFVCVSLQIACHAPCRMNAVSIRFVFDAIVKLHT